MNAGHIHRTESADGTEIAAAVSGDGPPVVLVHGAFGSGETSWVPLLPHLTDRYTCYAMSLRGRSPSGPSDDLSRDRSIDDVVAVAESIGEPIGLLGLSSGAFLSLAAAERSDAIAAVAAYEPPVFELLVDDLGAAFGETVERVTRIAQDGELAEAAETFLRVVTNDDEFAAISELGLPEMVVPNVEVQVREFPQFIGAPQPGPTDPGQLAAISAPVMLLQGTRSEPDTWFPDGVRYCADHIPNARIATIEGAGHLGPILEPAAVADAAIAFFAETLERV